MVVAALFVLCGGDHRVDHDRGYRQGKPALQHGRGLVGEFAQFLNSVLIRERRAIAAPCEWQHPTNTAVFGNGGKARNEHALAFKGNEQDRPAALDTTAAGEWQIGHNA